MDKRNNLVKYLELSTNESKLFNVLLEVGPVNATQIAKLAKLDKSSAYRAAERLIKQGLLKRSGHKYDQKVSIDFSQIKSKVEQKQEQIQQQLGLIDNLMQSNNFIPLAELLVEKIQVFEGEDVSHRLIEDRFGKGITILRGFESHLYETPAQLPTIQQWDTYIKRRVKEKMAIRLLLDHDHPSTELLKSNPKLLKEVRKLPPGYLFSTDINIYGDKVSFYNRRSMNILGIIITDESIAKLASNIYDFMWELATPV